MNVPFGSLRVNSCECTLHTNIHIYIYINILILISYYINGYDGAVGSLMLGKVQCIVGV